MVNGLRKRIVIIDEQSFAEGISFIIGFSRRFKIVGSYVNAEDSISNLKRDKPEIILMEIDLEGLDGLSATKRIRESWPSVEILIVSENNSSDVILEALSSGASGFITKNDDFTNQLVKFIEVLDEGGAPLSPDVARKIIESYWRNPSSPLSHREASVLKLISEGNTYSEIGELLNISKETSKTHIRNIYKKLRVKSRSQAVQRGITERLI